MRVFNLIKKYTGLLIRLDDITECMNWKLIEKCENLFNKYKIKPLLGVIPNNQDKEFLQYEKNEKFWYKVREWQDINWEISMHGFKHIYDTNTKKKDLFGYGGGSEFFGHSIEDQKMKIDEGLKIFKNEGVRIRSFFAPNHTYDLNTLIALKDSGISTVIDGYGFFPYNEHGLNFIPQLFYKEIMLPFGIQSTQIHLNYMDENKFQKFENFLNTYHNKVITFDDAISKINNNNFSKLSRFSVEKLLKVIRFKNKLQ